MAVQINVPPVQPFDPHGDTVTVDQRWKRWVRSFELFADATGCADSKQKRQLLLHSAGTDVQEIFFTLDETPVGYKEAKAKLDTHFTPIKNIPYQRHLFRQAKQMEGESTNQYVTRLRHLANDCEFGDGKNDCIRDQIIDKCNSTQLRTKLLAQKDLTLDKCIEIASAKEASEKQSSDIADDIKVYTAGASGGHTSKNRNHGNNASRKPAKTGNSANRNFPAKQRQQSSTSDKQCTRCGAKGHTGQECRCSTNITCWKCSKIGHFANCCRSTPPTSKTDNRQRRNTVKFVEEQSTASNENSDDDYVFSVSPTDGTYKVLIEDEPVVMIIDSGASCNIINTAVATKLKRQGVEFNSCSKTIHPYNSPPISARQSVTASVQVAGHEPVTADFLVIPGSAPSLLGKTTAEALGILHIGVNLIIQDTLSRYPGLSDGIGKLKDFEVKLHIDPLVPPVARKHSRVPFHLRDKVAEELERLEKQDVIEKVTGPTEWVSRIVAVPKPKNPNEIRICVDMREANRAIVRTRHVTPTVEELVADMNGAKVFSKIDLRAGYHQLVLKPESRYITTFSSHCGLYRYKRLSFGINSAAETFQHTIQTVIEGITGAKNVSDDIIVFGRDTADHDRALNETLSRLHNAGLTVNREKCVFHQPQVQFYGYIFSAAGLKPDPAKVKALYEASTPTNATEIRSFLGMAQFSARFIDGFATLTEPLRKLTQQDTPWTWGTTEETAFNKIRTILGEAATLAYFDIKKPIEILVDASPVGIAGLLAQDGKTVCYASRALSGVEQRYSQTEREALAVIWACEHFNIYVSGTSFTVITDHRPLLTIWEKPNPPVRIARWALRLQPYNLTMKYRPGKENPADYMSRHPAASLSVSSREEEIAEEFVNFHAVSSTPKAVTLEEVQTATANDCTLQAIIETVKTGRWHDNAHGINKDVFVSFRNVKDTLCVNADQNLLLKDTQLVIPESLQDRVIKLAHEGHQGVCKTKAVIRSKVWFPGIDSAVESAIRSCIPCQANSNRRDYEPLAMSDLPKGPWLHLSMDFCGPLPSGDSLLVITDEYSRYPVVEIVRNTTTEAIIPIVDKVFALFGYPAVIKTDNGPQFMSSQWKSFMNFCGIKHRRITPLWPKANAQAESFNKPLMKAVRSAHVQRKSWKQELYQFCRMYRVTPHCTTQFTPYYLLFGRDPRTKLPEAQSSTHPADAQIRSKDAAAKLKMKTYADKRHNATESIIQPGDSVLVKQVKQNKLSTNFNPTPLLVTDKKQSMVTVRRQDGSSMTRNSSLFRRLPVDIRPAPPVDDSSTAPMHPEEPAIQEGSETETSTQVEEGSRPPVSPRRSKRLTKHPQYLNDYIM